MDSATASSSSSTSSTAAKHADRMARLKQLHIVRQEARTNNHHEVVAEDARNKLPANWETRKRQADWLLDDDRARQEARAAGQDYDRLKLLEVSANEADRIEKKKKKRNPDVGFSDYEAQTARQYQRLVKQMAPRDMVKYAAQRERFGEAAFYGGAHTIQQGLHKDTPKAIDGMVKDLQAQIQKRKSFSRRRTHNDDADIDYINEKNARFNKKLERFYGEHTAEIKQNLERGTAI